MVPRPHLRRTRWRPFPDARIAAGLAIIAAMALAASFAPWLYPGDPLDMIAPSLIAPGRVAAFPLGTDALGRDVAAQLVHGARVSLLIGIGAAGFSLVVGSAIGGIAGLFGGATDRLLVRLMELFQTFPAFLLAIALVGIVHASISVVILAIGASSWAEVARLVRGEYRGWRNRDFIIAARALGYGRVVIGLREILPNALPPVVALAPVLVASAILTESGLSFLGLGDPNVVSWGSMIGDGRDYLRSSWHLVALPGAAIGLTVLAFNLIGEGITARLARGVAR